MECLLQSIKGHLSAQSYDVLEKIRPLTRKRD